MRAVSFLSFGGLKRCMYCSLKAQPKHFPLQLLGSKEFSGLNHRGACQKQRLWPPASCFTLIYAPAVHSWNYSPAWQAGARLTVASAGTGVGWRNLVLTTRLSSSESIFVYIIYIFVPVGAERWIHRKKRNHVRSWGSCKDLWEGMYYRYDSFTS